MNFEPGNARVRFELAKRPIRTFDFERLTFRDMLQEPREGPNLFIALFVSTQLRVTTEWDVPITFATGHVESNIIEIM